MQLKIRNSYSDQHFRASYAKVWVSQALTSHFEAFATLNRASEWLRANTATHEAAYEAEGLGEQSGLAGKDSLTIWPDIALSNEWLRR